LRAISHSARGTIPGGPNIVSSFGDSARCHRNARVLAPAVTPITVEPNHLMPMVGHSPRPRISSLARSCYYPATAGSLPTGIVLRKPEDAPQRRLARRCGA